MALRFCDCYAVLVWQKLTAKYFNSELRFGSLYYLNIFLICSTDSVLNFKMP